MVWYDSNIKNQKSNIPFSDFKMAKMSKYGYIVVDSLAQKGIRLIRTHIPEKMSKICSVSIVLKMSNLFHILDVFSGL